MNFRRCRALPLRHPSPDPMRMYATVVGRIAETALAGPRIPEPAPSEPAIPEPTQVTSGDVRRVRDQAGELVDTGRYTQAIELMRSMVPPAAAEFGEDSAIVLALRYDLANALFLDRDFQSAAPELADIADALSRQAGQDNKLVLDCRLNEASCLAGMGKTREALGRLLAVTGQPDIAWALLGDLLIDMRHVYGDDHPETESVQGLLARLDQLGR